MSREPNRHWADVQQLEAFRRGTLSEKETEERITHLSQCSECREALARLDDGLEVVLTTEEQQGYESQKGSAVDRDFQEVVRRAEIEATPSVLPQGSRTWPEAARRWLLRYWPAPLASGLVTIFLVLTIAQHSPTSRRAELDALYARAGDSFPAWTGSPGRLVQSFTPAPEAPHRDASRAPSYADATLESLEDSLLTLELPDPKERRERDVAVASLRLARGEIDSAWRLLSAGADEDPTPQGLTALACTALASGDAAKLRRADEVLKNAKSTDPAVLYDRVLLQHRLGDRPEARRLFEEYQRRVPGEDPWSAQLEALLG